MARIALALLLALLSCPTSCIADELADAINAKTSLTFERQSLQESLEALAERAQKKHATFAIKIAGSDLQLEGITHNQTIRDFKHEDQPLADILTALAVQANPVTNLKSPADPQQKLVWVIATDPDDDKRRMVLFTTRAAAAKRGDKLPKVFQTPQ